MSDGDVLPSSGYGQIVIKSTGGNAQTQSIININFASVFPFFTSAFLIPDTDSNHINLLGIDPATTTLTIQFLWNAIPDNTNTKITLTTTAVSGIIAIPATAPPP
jgi:hypothetical protein